MISAWRKDFPCVRSTYEHGDTPHISEHVETLGWVSGIGRAVKSSEKVVNDGVLSIILLSFAYLNAASFRGGVSRFTCALGLFRRRDDRQR